MKNKRTKNSIPFNDALMRLRRIYTDIKAKILKWRNKESLTILIKAEKKRLI